MHKSILKFQSAKNNSKSIVFSPDGLRLAVGVDYNIHLIDTTTNKHIQALTGHTCHITSIAWSPDSKGLASSSEDETVRVWLSQTLVLDFSNMSFYTGECCDVAWSPDGRQLAVACQHDDNGVFRIYNAVNGTPSCVLEGKDEYLHDVTCIKWLPDSRHVITSGWDEHVRVWNIERQTCQILLTCDDWVEDLSISPDGSAIAWSGYFHAAYCSIMPNTQGEFDHGPVFHFGVQDYKQHTVAWSPKGHFVCVMSETMVRVWNVVSKKLEFTLDVAAGPLTDIAWSPDGHQLAAVNESGNVTIWTLCEWDDRRNYAFPAHVKHLVFICMCLFNQLNIKSSVQLDLCKTFVCQIPASEIEICAAG